MSSLHPSPDLNALQRGPTGSRATRVLGVITLVFMVATLYMALVGSPPDEVQQDVVRLLYIHVPTAWVAMYLSFGVATLASALYLIPRTRADFWDSVAAASVEIGVLFLGLTLAVGSIWARATWGVWWTWDARLTTTAILFVVYLGYLAIRNLSDPGPSRAKRCAVVAILNSLNVPLVHLSVELWRTVHQKPTILRRDFNPTISGSMSATIALSVVAFTLLFAWLLIHRFRLAWIEREAAQRGLAEAITSRRAEADALPETLEVLS